MSKDLSARGFKALIKWYQDKTPQERQRIGVSLIVVSIVMVFSGNLFDGVAVKNAQEVAFEKYAEALEQASIAGKTVVIPSIRMEIDGGVPDQRRAFLIERERQDVVLRLLVLMREAHLFHLASTFPYKGAPVGSSDPLLEFQITGEPEVFQGRFSRSQLKGNVKAETLLKLIAVQGTPIEVRKEDDSKS